MFYRFIRNSVFYNLLRPQFVIRNKSRPFDPTKKYGLCSDAMTGWCLTDPKRETLNQRVKEATNNLYNIVIPEFAKHLVCKR